MDTGTKIPDDAYRNSIENHTMNPLWHFTTKKGTDLYALGWAKHINASVNKFAGMLKDDNEREDKSLAKETPKWKNFCMKLFSN